MNSQEHCAEYKSTWAISCYLRAAVGRQGSGLQTYSRTVSVYERKRHNLPTTVFQYFLMDLFLRRYFCSCEILGRLFNKCVYIQMSCLLRRPSKRHRKGSQISQVSTTSVAVIQKCLIWTHLLKRQEEIKHLEWFSCEISVRASLHYMSSKAYTLPMIAEDGKKKRVKGGNK